MAAIAAESGVAVQTVYFIFHTKAELLREVISYAGAGEHDAAPVMARSWIVEAMRADDGRRILALSMEHGSDIFARVAPLTAALEAAAQSDLEIADHVKAIDDARHGGFRALMRAIADKGWLRADLTVERATDIMFVVHSDASYRVLVRDCGWSMEEFKAWQYATLCRQLLADHGPNAEDGDPTIGLSFHGVNVI